MTSSTAIRVLLADDHPLVLEGVKSFKPEDFTRLAASRDIELGLTIKGRYFYFSTESSLSKINWQLVENIITISDKELVF